MVSDQWPVKEEVFQASPFAKWGSLPDLPLCKRGIEGDFSICDQILTNPPFSKEGVKSKKELPGFPF